MAYAMTKQGSLDNCITYEFICDTVTDMNAIENRYRTIGSVAVVLQGESGLEVYIAGSDRQWNSMGAMGASSAEASLSIYICSQNEVSNGLPDVDGPDEQTIYLVPASNTTNNLYDEYIYVDDAWERFGGASLDLSNYATLSDISGFYTKPQGGIPAADLAETYLTQHQDISGKANSADLAAVATSGSYNDLTDKPTEVDISGKADKADTVLSTTLSRGRAANSTVGTGSLAFGNNVTASRQYSHAEGENTSANGYASHAEGNGSSTAGQFSHAEGLQTQANAGNSHSAGAYTIADGATSYVFGQYNVADSRDAWSTWTPNTAYTVGMKVKRILNNNDETGYLCIEDNNDAEFNGQHWLALSQKMNYVEIVGNGENTARSNARALDWDGNEYLKGDLYVGANADSTGGNKVATEAFVTARIPTSPAEDGSYILKLVVNNGMSTYSWEGIPSASGVNF